MPARPKDIDVDLFADLESSRAQARAPQSYKGPDVSLIKRWLDGEDLPRKARVTKLKSYSVQLRSHALDHPDEALDAIIASVEFKIYQLMHPRKSAALRDIADPFGAAPAQKGSKQP